MPHSVGMGSSASRHAPREDRQERRRRALLWDSGLTPREKEAHATLMTVAYQAHNRIRHASGAAAPPEGPARLDASALFTQVWPRPPSRPPQSSQLIRLAVPGRSGHLPLGPSTGPASGGLSGGGGGGWGGASSCPPLPWAAALSPSSGRAAPTSPPSSLVVRAWLWSVAAVPLGSGAVPPWSGARLWGPSPSIRHRAGSSHRARCVHVCEVMPVLRAHGGLRPGDGGARGGRRVTGWRRWFGGLVRRDGPPRGRPGPTRGREPVSTV